MRSIARLLAGFVLALAFLPVEAHADPLKDALAKAYIGNPILRAARAGQRVTDEQVPQALSGWRPSLSVQDAVGPNRTWTTTTNTGFEQICSDGHGGFIYCPQTHTTTHTYNTIGNQLSIGLSQPIFRGFATTEGTAMAEANVKAGQANLLAQEQQVLFNAARAYMDVYEYRELIALQKENVRALQGQLNAANERFRVGEITRTDVAQARASLSAAKGQLSLYQAQLATNEATFLQVVGSPPGATPYPKMPSLPGSLEDAYRIAGELNPSILAQAFVEDAALHNVGVKRAPLLPQLSVQAALSSNYDFTHNASQQTVAQVVAVLSMQLYDGGLTYSLVRQAKQLASEQRINVIVQARAVRQVVAQAWNMLSGSRSKVSYDGDQVRAAQLALDGVKQEYQAGTRTTQDVLTAQQNLVTAQINRLQDRYSEIYWGYQLLSGIGKLTAQDQHLNVPIYDPNENYRRVRNKWIGTGVKTVN